MFCQSLGPSLYQDSTVLNFILFYFLKSGAAPSPCAGPALAWLRLTPPKQIMLNQATTTTTTTTTTKTVKLQPLHSITALGLFNVITGMTQK